MKASPTAMTEKCHLLSTRGKLSKPVKIKASENPDNKLKNVTIGSVTMNLKGSQIVDKTSLKLIRSQNVPRSSIGP